MSPEESIQEQSTKLSMIGSNKEKDEIKHKKTLETSPSITKPVETKMQSYYVSVYDLWYQSYCLARNLISEQIMTWLLLLAINPATGWFFHPFLFGWA